jgi:hypothetical protein
MRVQVYSRSVKRELKAAYRADGSRLQNIF